MGAESVACTLFFDTCSNIRNVAFRDVTSTLMMLDEEERKLEVIILKAVSTGQAEVKKRIETDRHKILQTGIVLWCKDYGKGYF